MENGFFQYSQSLIFLGLFPKILSPTPHPKCLKPSCKVGVLLEWARTKASRFGRFYQTVWFAWAIIPSPASRFWYQRKERDVPCPITWLDFQISDFSRPQSQSQWPFQTGVIVNNCRQARHVVRIYSTLCMRRRRRATRRRKVGKLSLLSPRRTHRTL